MTRLLNVHKVFAKSKANPKSLTAEERLLTARVMALALGDDETCLEQSAYEAIEEWQPNLNSKPS